VTGDVVTLYHRVLGERWHELPPALRAMHDLQESRIARGRAETRRGAGLLSRAIARLFGFPPAAPDVPVEVQFELRDGREIWTRRFGDRTFHSDQWVDTERFAGLLCERFGAFTFGLELALDQGSLYFNVKRAELGGLALPAPLTPVSRTREFERDGRFHFDVEISHPLVGLIVGYRGWLVPASRG
jgi:hypothetical protein